MQNELEKQVNFLVYSTPEQDIKVNAVLKDESIWLTQKAMAELFDCSTDNISLHLKNIYECNELQENATTEEFSVVQMVSSRKGKLPIAVALRYALSYLWTSNASSQRPLKKFI